MLVTLNDGPTTRLYDTEKNKVLDNVTVFGGRHGLRLHVYDPNTGDASQKFVTYDKDLQLRIMREMRSRTGHVNHDNTWVKPVIKPQEFWDESAERRMVLRDLQRYFGNAVTIRGNSIRYIYYLSDGRMENTADAIGAMFRKPLVYKGLVVATVFDIKGLDPLYPGYNVVHWLTKPMWDGFHTRYRKIPKEFPYPTGFVCSYWCQREGYGSYNNKDIRIASMTQGQTVGTWATTSLRLFWLKRQGKDVFGDFGQIFKPEKKSSNPLASVPILTAMANAISGVTPYGMIGLYCAKCGMMLNEPYGKCPVAKCSSTNSTYDIAGKNMCVKCGKSVQNVCECGDPYCPYSVYGCTCESPKYQTMGVSLHKKQMYALVHGVSPGSKSKQIGQLYPPITIGG